MLQRNAHLKHTFTFRVFFFSFCVLMNISFYLCFSCDDDECAGLTALPPSYTQHSNNNNNSGNRVYEWFWRLYVSNEINETNCLLDYFNSFSIQRNIAEDYKWHSVGLNHSKSLYSERKRETEGGGEGVAWECGCFIHQTDMSEMNVVLAWCEIRNWNSWSMYFSTQWHWFETQ